MIGRELWTMARKELLLLVRDLHGMLLLFIMPLVFIVVMSLAMRDQYAANAGRPQDVLVVDGNAGPASAELLATLRRNPGYRYEVVPAERREAARQRAREGKVAFLMEIRPAPAGSAAAESGAAGAEAEPAVELFLPARTTRQQELLFAGLVREALGRLRLSAWLRQMPGFRLDETAADADAWPGAEALSVAYLYGERPDRAPTAVQQSVPAWLIFAVFFIVVPLSNTFIQERQLGTLQRMSSMRVHPRTLMLGKLIPYFGVSQIQVVLMLLAGIYLVPWLGGDRLELGGSWSGLLLMSCSVSWAALGYALLIAVVARTPEQAVTLGGMGNIIWAAIGGIMVPTFIMPDAMQSLARFSPMAWALEGFLDVLLRGGGWALVWPRAGLLAGFGAACMFVAARLYRRLL